MDYLTSERPGTPNFKIDANFDMLISPMQKFSTGIQGVPTESWRQGLSENVVVFVAIIFKPELWLLKVNGIWNFGNVSKNKKPFGKITRLQFCVFCSAIESASKHTYWANADSIWKLETQNCSRVIFPNFLRVKMKFLGAKLVHPVRCQNFAGKLHLRFYNNWLCHISVYISNSPISNGIWASADR